jgi:hypothetical protein
MTLKDVFEKKLRKAEIQILEKLKKIANNSMNLNNDSNKQMEYICYM